MQFTIRNPLANNYWIKQKVIHDAYIMLSAYQLKYSDLNLNAYLEQNYNMNLKEASLYVLQNSTFHQGYNKSIVILFNDKKIDTIAALITYGNGHIKGSNILKKIFFRKD